MRERENGLFKAKPSTKAVFPFSRGKNRISQGVENRGSLISAPLALSVFWGVCKTVPESTLESQKMPKKSASPKVSHKRVFTFVR